MRKRTRTKPKDILITDMDGYNVHNPENSQDWVSFPSLQKAEAFAWLVERIGWLTAKYFIVKFTFGVGYRDGIYGSRVAK
jgi:hypothetical protein